MQRCELGMLWCVTVLVYTFVGLGILLGKGHGIYSWLVIA